jgi:transposase-like protein
MKKHRKHYTPEEKVVILRRHLLEKEPISKLCDELGLQATSFIAGRAFACLMATRASLRALLDEIKAELNRLNPGTLASRASGLSVISKVLEILEEAGNKRVGRAAEI